MSRKEIGDEISATFLGVMHKFAVSIKNALQMKGIKLYFDSLAAKWRDKLFPCA